MLSTARRSGFTRTTTTATMRSADASLGASGHRQTDGVRRADPTVRHDRRADRVVRLQADARLSHECRAFDPAIDVYAAEHKARRIGCVALVVAPPPITSAVAGDSHKNIEYAGGLQPLVDLGGTLGAAILGITHISKNSSRRKATKRIIGFVAFGALARVSMVTVMSKDSVCRLVRSKRNARPQGDDFEYVIQVTKHDFCDKTARAGWLPMDARFPTLGQDG